MNNSNITNMKHVKCELRHACTYLLKRSKEEERAIGSVARNTKHQDLADLREI